MTMNKIKILLITLISFISLLPIRTYALEYPNLYSKSVIVYDITDDAVLYEKNSNRKTAMASLTKIMTIITAIENNANPPTTIVYSKDMQRHVASYASVAGFKIGDKLTFDDLLYAAMLPSGADATVALAITTSGSLEKFVIAMNEMAKKLGMQNTNFVNVHGLDENNHYSTAKDIQILLNYALKNEKFKQVYTTKEYTLSTGKKIISTVKKQSDRLGLDTTKIIGSKTGFTENAGLCISALIKHQDHDLIFITIKAPIDSKTIPYNIADALDLISFIEKSYGNHKIISKDTPVIKLNVKNSKIDSYEIKTTKEITKFLANDYNKEDIKIDYIGKKELSYKNEKNEKLGTIKYYYQGNMLDEESVYLTTEIKADYIKIIKANKNIIFTTIAILTLLIIVIITLIKSKRKK